MDEGSLQLALDVVKHDHADSEPLVESKGFIALPDCESQGNEQQRNKDRSCILDVEYSLPADLGAKILKVECHCAFR